MGLKYKDIFIEERRGIHRYRGDSNTEDGLVKTGRDWS